MDTGIDASTGVCVLGMSRSGTSLTTRLLDLAGVYLGPEDELLQRDMRQLAGEGEAVLARAREANPGGFFEHYRITRHNERILRTLGGNWREPPQLPPGWEASEAVAAEREEARALLDANFAGKPLWGWKDPRNSLTLPLWQLLVPDLRYVICLRNPVDVANSLRRRDGISLERGLDLWLFYVASALVNTSARPRLLMRYESYFEGLHGAASRLARFAGREGAFEGAEVKQMLAEAVDERLWRNRTAMKDVVGDRALSHDAVGLYLLTELLADADSGRADSAELQAAVDLYAEELLSRHAPAPAL